MLSRPSFLQPMVANGGRINVTTSPYLYDRIDRAIALFGLCGAGVTGQ
jgi:hypothetical protein